MGMTLDYSSLKERQCAERDNHPTNLGLRLHRALSWLDRVEQFNDQDGQFIFLWIAFKNAYVNELGDRERIYEKQLFQLFLAKLADLDKDEILYMLIWSEFPQFHQNAAGQSIRIPALLGFPQWQANRARVESGF